MGYITCFDIRFIGDDKKVEAFKKDLLESTKFPDGKINEDYRELLETGYLCAKCYDLDDNITKIALKYPDVMIIVNGDGEDSDDLWEARWKGDKYELNYAEIPPFVTPELQIPDKNN